MCTLACVSHLLQETFKGLHSPETYEEAMKEIKENSPQSKGENAYCFG